MSKDWVQLSRVVSHALRHVPWVYELELDEEGWTNIDALIAALRQESPDWSNLSRDDLVAMMSASPKQRHELIGDRIRAHYGHSLPGKLRKMSAEPPLQLFHGTSPTAIAKIRETGLLPIGRQYVHLSSDRETAVSVGKRKSPDATILLVMARKASAQGVAFYLGNEKVWLADGVPPNCIDFRL